MYSSRQPRPERVPTDKVVPVHYWDDGVYMRTMIVLTVFVFDDVLDPDKLRSALERVVQREGWQKLGGRLRQNVRDLELARRHHGTRPDYELS